MKTIKYLLYKILGLKIYLKIVSYIYIKYMDWGFGKTKYTELHYLKNIIKPDFFCIDIGANLGYYSYFLSKLIGKDGKLIAIEPVPLFGKIWEKNIRRLKIKNAVLYPYALGAENKKVKMGMPVIKGNVHHGMTKIIENINIYQKKKFTSIRKNKNNIGKIFNVEMKIPDELFEKLKKLDFIKIDIEGYEYIALKNMKKTLRKHKPIIQAELSGKENRRKSIELLYYMSYNIYILKSNQLVEIIYDETDNDEIDNYDGDFYFITKIN